jgi:hypothetical protein
MVFLFLNHIPGINFAAMLERWATGIAILIGFLWIRSRIKTVRNDGERSRKALYGIFFVLAPLLLIGKQGFDRLPFGRYANLLVELGVLALVFGVTGFAFLRPGLDANGQDEKRDA